MEKFWRSLKTVVCRISCCAILHFKKDAPGMMLSSKKLPIMVIRNLPIRSWQHAGMLSFVMPVFPEGIAFPTSGYKCGSPTLAGGYLNPVLLGMNPFAVDIEKQMTLSGVCLHVVGLHPRGKSQ